MLTLLIFFLITVYLVVGVLTGAVVTRIAYEWSGSRRAGLSSAYTLGHRRRELRNARTAAYWLGGISIPFWPIAVVIGMTWVVGFYGGRFCGRALQHVLTPALMEEDQVHVVSGGTIR